MGYEADERPESAQAEQDLKRTGHDERQERALQPVLGDHPGGDDGNGARGAGDLAGRTAEDRREESGEDRTVQPDERTFRRAGRGNAEGNGQWQGHDGNGQAGQDFLGDALEHRPPFRVDKELNSAHERVELPTRLPGTPARKDAVWIGSRQDQGSPCEIRRMLGVAKLGTLRAPPPL